MLSSLHKLKRTMFMQISVAIIEQNVYLML